jgi:hypothetical protein
MATILNKDLVRESTVEIGGTPVVVTIQADQSLSFKLKGVRGGDVLNISIADLWEYLGGAAPKQEKGSATEIKKTKPKKGDNKMISLYDLRSANAISDLAYADMAKFDGIIVDMIKNLDL